MVAFLTESFCSIVLDGLAAVQEGSLIQSASANIFVMMPPVTQRESNNTLIKRSVYEDCYNMHNVYVLIPAVSPTM